MANVSIDGHAIHYEDQGAGDVVVLLHGLGSSSRDWEYQIPALVDAGYRVIAPDALGFGRSGRPHDIKYSVPLWSVMLRELLVSAGVERCHLVGYSMGGAIAYEYAVTWPDALLSLTIVNSVPVFKPQSIEHHWQYLFRKLVVRAIGMQALANVIARKLFEGMPELEAKMRVRYAQNDRVVYIKALSALSRWDARERLGVIGCPVRIFAAAHDYFDLDDVREGMEALPQAELVCVPDARHGLPVEHPQRFNQELLAFLAASSAACRSVA